MTMDPEPSQLEVDLYDTAVQLAAAMDWTVEEAVDWLREQLFADLEPIVSVAVIYS